MWLQSGDVGLELGAQSLGRAADLQGMVVQGPAALLQLGGEVPHGREKEGAARLVGEDLGGFVADLGHPKGVLLGVKAIEGRSVQVELIAQHGLTPQETAQLDCLTPSCRMGDGMQALAGRRFAFQIPDPE